MEVIDAIKKLEESMVVHSAATGSMPTCDDAHAHNGQYPSQSNPHTHSHGYGYTNRHTFSDTHFHSHTRTDAYKHSFSNGGDSCEDNGRL